MSIKKTSFKTITKAILPIAGLGTRFLPATKVMPKEMLPICGKPIVHILVEEAYKAGIKEIIFIINKEKEPIIRDYFSHETPTSRKIAQKGKEKALNDLNHLLHNMKFHYVIQHDQRGDGHAILQAKKYIKKGESFAVLFGDDIVMTAKTQSALSQLISAHKKHKSHIIALEEVPKEKLSSYGIVKLAKDNSVEDLIEKPLPHLAPSNLGIIGKYVLTSDIFKNLKTCNDNHSKLNTKHQKTPNQTHPHTEIRLIDGFKNSLKSQKIFGLKIKGTRYDTGTLDGFRKAICEIDQI